MPLEDVVSGQLLIGSSYHCRREQARRLTRRRVNSGDWRRSTWRCRCLLRASVRFAGQRSSAAHHAAAGVIGRRGAD